MQVTAKYVTNEFVPSILIDHWIGFCAVSDDDLDPENETVTFYWLLLHMLTQ